MAHFKSHSFFFLTHHVWLDNFVHAIWIRCFGSIDYCVEHKQGHFKAWQQYIHFECFWRNVSNEVSPYVQIASISVRLRSNYIASTWNSRIARRFFFSNFSFTRTQPFCFLSFLIWRLLNSFYILHNTADGFAKEKKNILHIFCPFSSFKFWDENAANFTIVKTIRWISRTKYMCNWIIWFL